VADGGALVVSRKPAFRSKSMTVRATTRVRHTRRAVGTRQRPSARLAVFQPPAAGNAVDHAAQGARAEVGSATSTRSQRRWTVGRVARWVFGATALLLLALVGWFAFLIIRLQTTIYKPLPPTPTALAAIATTTPVIAALGTAAPQQAVMPPTPDPLRLLPPGRFNILVLGTDKRPNDPDHYARSDTLLLANVDTISRTVRIMSVPRDLIVDVPDYGKSKVNSAYFFGEYDHLDGGGQALAVRSISQFFNVPIDYYITVNFQGFEKIVDTVGGVDIDVPYSLDDYNYPSDDTGDLFGEIHVHFDAGLQHMDGKTALRYARTRHADNDFARSKRQLQIILAVRQKAMALDLIPSVPSLIDQLGGMIETNIPFDQQLALVQLGYGITASSILTSSIDASMITAATLPDGSEGLKLNAKAAQPMLDEFFGWDTSSIASDVRSYAAETPTVQTSAKSRPTSVPTRAPVSNRP
jgi:polyisoprenyl-teichoic acid--peptidoglycan teichoic acid transferase